MGVARGPDQKKPQPPGSHILLLDPREPRSRLGREGGAAPASFPPGPAPPPAATLCTGHPGWTGCTARQVKVRLGSRSCSPPSAGSTGHGCPCLHGPDGQCAVTLALIQIKIVKVMFRNYIYIYRERETVTIISTLRAVNSLTKFSIEL